MVNPQTASQTFYVRISTYASDDGSGAWTEFGAIAASTASELSISSEVPPRLTFCVGLSIQGDDCSTVTGGVLDMGTFNPTSTQTGTTKMLATTNAEFGYNITVKGPTFASGNHLIDALNAPANSQTGQAQFGINLRKNTSPAFGADPAGAGVATPSADYNTPDRFVYRNGDVVAASPSVTNRTTFTVSYIVNIPADQPSGFYATTISYICLATF